MIRIQQTFKAHPIGQGFFYTGRLRGGHSEFNFVFDCGSLSYSVLNDTIDRYRTIQTRDIDLLIISHFDADHINGLKRLLEGRKVKKVVAPFIGLEQRISILLNFRGGFDQSNPRNPSNIDPNIDNTYLSIIDFTEVLKDELDGADFYFIESSDDKPREPNDDINIVKLSNDSGDFDFNFEGNESLNNEEKLKLGFNNIGGNVFKIKCNQFGLLTSGSLNILDLIFYKKKLGEKENKFYDEVFKSFIKENNISFKNVKNPSVEELVDTIKKYKGAKKIKELFRNAASEVDIDLSITEITNLNTTALCMFHFDRIRYNCLKSQNENDIHYIDGEYNLIQVINKRDLFLPIISDFFHYHRRFRDGYYFNTNTLLTADSFLKDENDVNSFISHYNFYLDKIAFFQIPHHGSRHSSDLILLSHINSRHIFINYGVNHSFIKSWSHPNNEVINNIVSAGYAGKLLPVNEYSGYQLNSNIHFYLR